MRFNQLFVLAALVFAVSWAPTPQKRVILAGPTSEHFYLSPGEERMVQLEGLKIWVANDGDAGKYEIYAGPLDGVRRKYSYPRSSGDLRISVSIPEEKATIWAYKDSAVVAQCSSSSCGNFATWVE